MKPGDIVDAGDVPDGSLVRDSMGVFYMRHGRGGQVARNVGPWRVWGELQRFAWFRSGRFEIVALGVAQDATSADLQAIGDAFEAAFGEHDFWEQGSAIPATATDVD